MRVWINGRWVREEEAKVSLFDRSYLHGEGVFETLKCYGGKPAFLDRHHRRLRENAQKLEIPLPISLSELETVITELTKANNAPEAAVRITLSLVGTVFGVGRPPEVRTNLTVFCRNAPLNPGLYQTGVKLLAIEDLVNDAPAIANVKTTSYLTKMLARQKAAAVGAYEGLLKNAAGYWAEGSRTNLFVVSKGVILTPPLSDGILPGITREVVLEIIREKKMSLREDHIPDPLLENAEEIFLTGSTSEVLPAAAILNRPRFKPAGFETASRLRTAYTALARQQTNQR